MYLPPLDVNGFIGRTAAPRSLVMHLVNTEPGWIERQIRSLTGRIYAQLRKRYDRTIPFGLAAPDVTPQGTTPPAVSLLGTPSVGSLELQLAITGAGPLGTATFKWSPDGGTSVGGTGLVTGPAVSLSGTGLSAAFSAGTYAADNVYTAPTPVPECFLNWLTWLLTYECYRKRGADPSDPQIATDQQAAARAWAEIAEAADGNVGKFDLPLLDDVVETAISSPRVLSFSDSSPFASADRQEAEGWIQDAGFCGGRLFR